MAQYLPSKKLTESIQTQEQQDRRGRGCAKKKSRKRIKMLKRKRKKKRKTNVVKIKKMQSSLTITDATTLITTSHDRNTSLKLTTLAHK